MPEINKHIEKICFHCRNYQIRVPQGPVCLFWNKVFPDHNAWAYNPDKKKPGERTCRHWEGRSGPTNFSGFMGE